ncbi:MAG: hypothetical protein F6J98_11735 [Moorea sp. SIO4G2]|nr:hypothetical protein [Moorena sp. SIO4A3]NEO61074.1 hypothetical protein [Moorena sp. SIO4G2]
MQWPHGEAARSWGFPPLALCRGFPHSRFAVVSPTRALHQDKEVESKCKLSVANSSIFPAECGFRKRKYFSLGALK